MADPQQQINASQAKPAKATRAALVNTPAAIAGTAQTVKQKQNDALSDFRNRRLQRRLEDLERTNPTDIPNSSFLVGGVGAASASGGGIGGIGVGVGKKKQSGNVRRVLTSRKGLRDFLDELPKDPTPPYILAASPQPLHPPRNLCSSCGYTGAYKCGKCGEWSCDRLCLDTHARDGGCGVGN